MKKYLKIISVAVLIGGVMAFLFYKDIKKEVKAITSKDDVLYLFQVGVFKSLDNATEFGNNYKNKIIYQDGEYYRVIIDVTYNNKEMLEGFYSNLNIEYYIKEVKVSKNILDKIKQYEIIRTKATNNEVIYSISNNILELFNTYIENK